MALAGGLAWEPPCQKSGLHSPPGLAPLEPWPAGLGLPRPSPRGRRPLILPFPASGLLCGASSWVWAEASCPQRGLHHHLVSPSQPRAYLKGQPLVEGRCSPGDNARGQEVFRRLQSGRGWQVLTRPWAGLGPRPTVVSGWKSGCESRAQRAFLSPRDTVRPSPRRYGLPGAPQGTRPDGLRVAEKKAGGRAKGRACAGHGPAQADGPRAGVSRPADRQLQLGGGEASGRKSLGNTP